MNLRRRLLFGGALYRTGLSLVGTLATGYGHGTWVFLGLAAAPLVAIFSLLGLMWAPFLSFGVLAAMLASPFMWGWIWSLLRKNDSRRHRFLIVIIVYYASVIAVLATTYFGEWDYIVRSWQVYPSLIVVGFSWYGAGQILMWLMWFLNRNQQE